MIFIYLVLCYVGVYYIKEYLDRQKSPPGPWPVPILGTLGQISRAAKLPNIALANIANQYGSDITRHKMGSQETVVLSSYEAFTEVLTSQDVLGRPLLGWFYDRSNGKRFGIITTEGKSWVTKRNWTFRTLRDFGLGKSQAMENIILEIVDIFLNDMANIVPSGEGVFNVESAFTVPVFKIMWKMLAGRCTPEDDKVIARLLEKNEKMLKSGTFGAGLTTVFPIIKLIAPEWSGYNTQMDLFADIKRSARNLLREIKSDLTKGVSKKVENLTEAYILKMKKDPDEFNEEDFEILFMDLLQAASDTTSSFLEACMLFMILNPEVQRKVYREILESIPQGQQPVIVDLKRMKYTQACLLEIHRCTKVGQLFVPRRATKDFYYKEYLIKKDTQILADCHSVFNSKWIGDDPEVFRPERFLTEDGVLTENSKHVIPFSIGKRNCPGESLAEMTSFLFFVNILRNYELSLVPGKTPPTSEMTVGFTSRPFPFKMWVKTRGIIN